MECLSLVTNGEPSALDGRNGYRHLDGSFSLFEKNTSDPNKLAFRSGPSKVDDASLKRRPTAFSLPSLSMRFEVMTLVFFHRVDK